MPTQIIDAPPVDAPIEKSTPRPDRDSSTGAGAPPLLRAYRLLLLLAFLGSLILPGLTYNSSPVEMQIVPSVVEQIFKIGGYCIFVLLGVGGFHAMMKRLEPHFQEQALSQTAFLETVSGKYLLAAIAASAGLSLFLELAVIRWQGTIFEFFAFYKNYGLLACFAGLGLGYALSRDDNGILLNLTPLLLIRQFGLLIFLRFGLPQSSDSLATVPFREQLSMGLPTATPAQDRAVYLLLAVTFLLTSLAFIPIGQLCGKLMENTSRLSAYGLNLFGSLIGVSLMFLVSFLWTPPVVWFGLCFLALCLFLRPRPRTLFIGMTFTVVAIVTF